MELAVLGPAVYEPNKTCPHFAKGLCTALSNRVGHATIATGVRCQVKCQGNPDAMDATAVLQAEYEPKFLAKVWSKYPPLVALAKPPVASTIRLNLTELRAQPFVTAIYLTGSLLDQSKREWKDYDIAVVVNDIKAYRSYQHKLPEQINGVKTDWMMWTKRHPYFPALDLDSNKVYLPALSPLRFGSSRLQVVPTDLSDWAPSDAETLQAIYQTAFGLMPSQASSSSSTPAPVVAKQRTGNRAAGGCGCSRNRQ